MKMDKEQLTISMYKKPIRLREIRLLVTLAEQIG